QVSHRRPPEVVRNLAGNASQLAGGQPRFSEPFDGLAFAMKQPRNDYAFFPLERLSPRHLLFEHLAEPRRQRKHATLVVLGLSRIEPQPPSSQIKVMPLARQQLVRHAPAGYVSRLADSMVMLWQMLEHSLELVMLEEAFAGIA